MSASSNSVRASVGASTAVECLGLTVAYGSTVALSGVDLTVRERETVALLGPSGAGKTTLLHAVAGFIEPSAGEIRIGGRTVSGSGAFTPPEQRSVGMVFQQFALWPHLDALDTVAYPLLRAGVAPSEARREAGALLARLGLNGLEHRRPSELSGGQQQRIALARALARRPQVLLLDEPTAHLDAAARADLHAELARQRSEEPATTLHATHDVEEALGLADRVGLMRDGAIIQVGTPREVYEQPVDRWAAVLTGPSSVLEGRLQHDGMGRWELRTGDERTPVELPRDATRSDAAALLVRPDWACLGGPLRGRVRTVRFRGTHTDYEVESAFGAVQIRDQGPPRVAPGEPIGWSLTRGWPLQATGGAQR
jgi:ABC-type Fe3+/spermidine/putrescine transport system ATPase subunit